MHPELLVLDSTDPAQIRRFVSQIDFDKTLFIVSSKSGTTLEPNILKDFFYVETQRALGRDDVGDRFIAVTDPGSELQRTAEAQHFRRIFFGSRDIGGRFSALSNFGMMPAALMGLDVGAFLTRTREMVHACSPHVPLEENPGILLGLLLGVAGNHEREKITLVISPDIRTLGAWIEQLLAESTGKKGKGLLPVNEEDLGAPGIYGHDRLFCYIRDKHAPDPVQDAKMDALEVAGRPVVRIDVYDKYDLGQEFFRWQIATATAGSLLGLNPFDQPDVEASKLAMHQLMTEFEFRGALPTEPLLVQDEDFEVYADARNAAELTQRSYGQKSVPALLEVHLQRLDLGDYFALLAFMDMNDEYKAALHNIRSEVLNRCHVATSLGFGPRYLHSTGQFHKGGPNRGVFLGLTWEDPLDLPVPGRRFTFGIVEAAQARGDLQVLADRGRRVLHVHIRGDPRRGLARLHEEVAKILK